MNLDDILIIDNAFDVLEERNKFVTQGKELGDSCTLNIARLLNIEERYFERDLGYSPESKYREYNLIIKEPVRVNFKDKNHFTLEKYDRLNGWKNCQETFESICQKINSNGLNLKFIAKSPTTNNSEIIFIAKVL